MKRLSIILALFALLIIFRGGRATVFPGNNILIYQDVQYGERLVSVGVVYDADGKEVTRIPADLIAGVGSIADPEPETEM